MYGCKILGEKTVMERTPMWNVGGCIREIVL